MGVIAQRTSHVAGPPAPAGRLGRSEPVHSARRRGRDRACCERCSASSSLRSARWRWSGSATSACASQSDAPGGRQAGGEPTSTERKRRSRTSSAPAGRPRTRPFEWTSTWWLRARSAGSSTTRRCRALRCRIVAGAANNQLANEPSRIARARHILWAPDFVVNAGGLINIAEEQNGIQPHRRRPARPPNRRDHQPDLRRGRRDGRHAPDRRARDRAPTPGHELAQGQTVV